jgi:hypothetical protein
MPMLRIRSNVWQVICSVLFALTIAGAQMTTDRPSQDKNVQGVQAKNGANKGPSQVSTGSDYSGMYSFLSDGEFVQLTVDDQGQVTGFVSRYGDSESDRGVFLDHFFKTGKLEGNQLSFITEVVHGVSLEFRGTIERGGGKSRADEGYYVLKGTVVENITDDAKKVSSKSHEVALKSFPQDMTDPETKKK